MRSVDPAVRRRLASSTTLGAGVALVVALVLIVNYFGWKYHQRFDWTRGDLYSLSEKSLGVVDGLDREVEAVVFMSPVEDLYDPVMELLRRYEARSPRLRVRAVDPEKNLIEAQSLVDRYELSQLNVVVFDSGEDRRVVAAADLADYDYSGLQFGEGPRMTGFKGEQLFTSTLLDLMESRKPRILFTSGHGELRLDDLSARGLSAAREILGRDNFDLEEWATLGEAAVPSGTDLVVVAGPTSSFIEPEIDLLRSYLGGGGRLLVLLDPTLAPSGGLVATGLEPFLAELGVEVGEDIVVDPANPLPFFGAETIFVDSYGDHDITRALRQARLPVILPLGRSVAAAGAAEGFEATELMRTSAEGWGERDLADLGGEVERGEGDLAGPVSLAVAVAAVEGDREEEDPLAGLDPTAAEEPGAEGAGEGGAAEAADTASRLRLVVVGDSDFATNGQLQNVPNATFLANTLNWLVERESLIGIPAKEPEQVRLSLTGSQLSRITLLVLLLLPGSAIALGAMVFWRRRR